MDDHKGKDETLNILDVKVEALKEEYQTIYIGIDPSVLMSNGVDFENLFGYKSYLNYPKKENQEEDFSIEDFLMQPQANKEDKEYECEICSYKSYNKTHFKRHMARVHEKGYHCEKCPFACGSGDYLKEHIKAMHDGEKLKCKQCPAEFTWRTDLHRHVKGIHSGIVYSCPVCSVKLSSDKSLKRHISKSKCRLHLPADFSVADLEHHIKSGKEEPIVGIKITRETIVNNNSETKVLNTIFSEKPVSPEKPASHEKLFHCTSCDKKFSKKSNLKVHINSVHEKNKTESCDQCDYKCTVKDSLRQHISSVHNGEKFNCKHCEKQFNWKSDMNRHIRTFHSAEVFHCPECSKQFPQKRYLKEHLLTKSCSKSLIFKNKKLISEDLICSFCGYTTADSRTLDRHVNGVHLKEGLTKCDQCEYSSIRPDDVKRHIEHKHIGKQYICEICSKICKWKSDLEQHMKKHEGLEYSCDICSFKTVYQSGLSRHKKSVHEGIKHQCDQCDQCYTQISSLNTHKKAKHSHQQVM